MQGVWRLPDVCEEALWRYWGCGEGLERLYNGYEEAVLRVWRWEGVGRVYGGCWGGSLQSVQRLSGG